MRMTTMMVLLALLMATAAWAQDNDSADAKSEVSKAKEILKIIGLPGMAEEARESGMAEEDIRIIFEEARRRKLPPSETGIILRESSAATRENGPVDNFGAVVKEKLDRGLRGRDLADAIHEEHRLRGKGKGKGHGGKDGDQAREQHRHKEQVKGDGHGRGNQGGPGEGDNADRDRNDDNDNDRDDGQNGQQKNKRGKGK